MIGARASRCAWVAFGSKETVTHVAFFSVPHLSPRSPVNQYFVFARSTFPECPSRTVTAILNSRNGCSACLCTCVSLKEHLQNRWHLHASTESAFIRHNGAPGAPASEFASPNTTTTTGHAVMFTLC